MYVEDEHEFEITTPSRPHHAWYSPGKNLPMYGTFIGAAACRSVQIQYYALL